MQGFSDTPASEDFDDAGHVEKKVDLLPQVEAKGAELVSITRLIADAEADLADFKARKAELEFHELPDLMKDANITSVTVGNIPIELENIVQASLPKEDRLHRARILDWVIRHGHGGIIRREVIVPLPMGDDAAKMKVLAALENVIDTASVEETIHAQSYTALCRRLIKGDQPVSLELLNIFVAQRAKIKEK